MLSDLSEVIFQRALRSGTSGLELLFARLALKALEADILDVRGEDVMGLNNLAARVIIRVEHIASSKQRNWTEYIPTRANERA